MAKLSQWQKPEYQRADMWHGGLNGYQMEYSPTGQTVSVHGIFRTAPFTNSGINKVIFRAYGGGGTTNHRLTAIVSPSDYSDATARNKLLVSGLNSTGAVILNLCSLMEVTDNRYHSFCASYDATSGAFTFPVDMVPVDDTGWASRVTSTGTLGTTANSIFTIGMAALDGTQHFPGEISFLAHRSAYYVSDWTPFFFPNGQPRRLDMVGWTQWGTAPGVFNPNGDNEANMGGQGPHRRVGNLVPRIEQRALRSTRDGVQHTAGIVFAMTHQRSARALTYDESIPQINPPGSIMQRIAVTCDTNGYTYKSGNYAELFRITNLPAKAATIRLYQMVCRYENVAPTSGHGLVMGFNYQDPSNYWFVSVAWNGSNWQLDLAQYIGAVYTSRGIVSLSGVNYPAHFVISAADNGDAVVASLHGYEVDVPANRFSASVHYSVASRPFKTATGANIYNNGDPGTNMRARSLLIMDI